MNDDLTEIFKSFDKDEDGLLNNSDLLIGYTNMLGTVEKASIEVELILEKL